MLPKVPSTVIPPEAMQEASTKMEENWQIHKPKRDKKVERVGIITLAQKKLRAQDLLKTMALTMSFAVRTGTLNFQAAIWLKEGKMGSIADLRDEACKIAVDNFMLSSLKLDQATLARIKVVKMYETKAASNDVVSFEVASMNMMHILNGNLKNVPKTTHVTQQVPDQLLDVFLGLQSLGYVARQKKQ